MRVAAEFEHPRDLAGGIDLTNWQRGDPARATLRKQRAWLRDNTDMGHLDRADLAWARTAFVEGFLFGYDSAWFDRAAGRFNIDAFLDDGEREFGGYDLLVLWQPYPRMGIDGRSLNDFWRDWPGGIGGLRDMIARCHERGVRCLLNHVRWDVKRPHTWAEDMVGYGAVLNECDADGIYLDTLNYTPAEIRAAVDKIRPGMLIETEYNPPLGALAAQPMGWSQDYRPEPLRPFVQKWVAPRSLIRLVNRGSRDRRFMIAQALFWGHGICVWENVFGFWNPFTAGDRAMMQRVVPLLRVYADAFADAAWEPLERPLAEGVFGNRFTDGARTIITLLNTTEQAQTNLPLPVPVAAGQRAYDVWQGRELLPLQAGGGVAVSVEARSCSMLVIQPADAAAPPMAPHKLVHTTRAELRAWPDAQTAGSWRFTAQLPEGRIGEHVETAEERQRFVFDNDFRTVPTLDAHRPRPVPPTVPHAANAAPAGMVHIPGGRFVMSVTHLSRKLEGGCYGDGATMHHPPQHFWLPALFMDQTEVTQKAYAVFLGATGYRPRHLDHFLDDWTKPDAADVSTWSPQSERANHPVVWVDLDDARAYAAWAGKRLPREEEWQYAAEGGLGRAWPWGDTFEPDRANHDTPATTPVGAFPRGASAHGILDLAGNVWEWTESERDDGHTRYAILRGGSHLIQHGGDHPEAWGKMWYTAEGAQPNQAHQKMLLITPRLDRCATIGFRCVADVAG